VIRTHKNAVTKGLSKPGSEETTLDWRLLDQRRIFGLTVSNDGQSVRKSAVLEVGTSKQRRNAVF